MSISGHTTISMFLPYNITSDADQRDVLRRVGDNGREARRFVRA